MTTLDDLKQRYPRVTALIVWAVLNDRLTANIIRYAARRATSDDLMYDIVRVVVGGNPALVTAVQDEAKYFLKEMIL